MPIKMTVGRILFIRSDRIGDVLMNLPAVHRLRQNYPKAWLAWMVDRSVAPLLRGHPDVDEILEIDPVKLKEDASYRKQLVGRVRRIRFDLGIASNPSKFFHWMMFAGLVRHRAGWRRKWGFLLNRSPGDRKKGRHEIDSNLELVGTVAPKPWDGTWHLPVDEAASAAIRKRLNQEFGPDAPVIAIHAGTSDPAKRWPLERFAAVCSGLLRSGHRVLLIGGSEEEAFSRELASRLPEGFRDWTGALDLQELSALFHSSRVRTLLSSDSGPVHIAWLHRKPVVALYAKNTPGSDPARWGPRSRGSVAIHKDMRDISAGEVLAALEKVVG